MDKSRLAAEAKAAWRTNALFKAMSTDYLLREQFATDPAQVLSNYVHGTHLTEAAADTTNQLLLAVMSCPPLRRWMGVIASRDDQAQMTRHAFALEFAKEVAASGDDLVTLALIRSASDKDGEFLARLDLLRWIIGAIGAGTTASGAVILSDGNNMSIGAVISPDTLQNTDLVRGSLQNIERLSEALLQLEFGEKGTDSVGNEMSPGSESAMSTAGRPLIESLVAEVRLAARLNDQLGRAAPNIDMNSSAGTYNGTDMSPGTHNGTDMSPGGTYKGTDMSPGTETGTVRKPGFAYPLSHTELALDVLAQYGANLRSSGALSVSGLEGV